MAACSLMVGCGSKGPESAPNAQSAERQSEAQYDIARDYFYKGQPRVALDHVRKAIELDDENAKALYFAAGIHLSFCSGDRGLDAPDCSLAAAEKYDRAALKVDEHFRDAQNMLGAILILEKRYVEAEKVLEPLTRDQAYEANYLAWANLGWAQVLGARDMRGVEAGIVSLQNAVTQPKFCVGHYRLGVAYEKKGDLALAETSLTNAVTVESPDCQNLQDAWEARARVRMKEGKGADAKADFEKCKEISSRSLTGKACDKSLHSSAP